MKQIDLEYAEKVLNECPGDTIWHDVMRAYLSQQRMTPDPAKSDLWVCRCVQHPTEDILVKGLWSYEPIHPYAAPSEADVSEGNRARALSELNEIKDRWDCDPHYSLTQKTQQTIRSLLTRAKSDERVVALDNALRGTKGMLKYLKRQVELNHDGFNIVVKQNSEQAIALLESIQL